MRANDDPLGRRCHSGLIRNCDDAGGSYATRPLVWLQNDIDLDHHKLTDPIDDEPQYVILPEPGGYGGRRWGEGKWGGMEETVVAIKDGAKRALSSVLQNVFDAWMQVLGQPQTRINEF